MMNFLSISVRYVTLCSDILTASTGKENMSRASFSSFTHPCAYVYYNHVPLSESLSLCLFIYISACRWALNRSDKNLRC